MFPFRDGPSLGPLAPKTLESHVWTAAERRHFRMLQITTKSEIQSLIVQEIRNVADRVISAPPCSSRAIVCTQPHHAFGHRNGRKE